MFDAKKWHLPIMERQVAKFELGLDLEKPDDVSRPEVEKRLVAFVADFFAKFHEIAAGKKPDWGNRL